MSVLHRQTKQKMSPQAKREAIDGYIGILPWAIGFLAFTFIPLCAAAYLSFCYWDILTPIRWAGLANYANILRDPQVKNALWNTFRYTVAVVPLTTGLGVVIALMLSRNTKGILFFRVVYYLPSVLPGVAVAMLWIWMYNPDFGVINTLLSYLGIQGPAWLTDKTWAMWAIIIRACWGVGGGMILFLGALQGVPNVYYEASVIDGANAWQKFWNITFPMITPTIFYFVITGVIGSLQEYVLFRVMTNGGPARSTKTLVFYIYEKAFQNYVIGYGTALSWLMFLIALIMTVLLFKSSGWVYYEGEDTR